jgi:OmpA-OmpF porin, OOP family
MKKITSLLFVFVAVCVHAQLTHENLGAEVNSAYDELQPYITADGKKMFFSREDHPQNTLSPQNTQDIWYCKKNEEGKWETARHLTYPFNQTKFAAIFYQSPDGTRRVIRGFYKKGKYEGSGFSECRLTTKGWSDPEGIEIDRYEKMSKGPVAGICLSPDNQVMVLYFSESENGDESLYVSFRKKENKWSTPISLGAIINLKKYCSSTPFIAADGKTLYFASNRPGGEGSYDIWMSRRLDDSWTSWSEPQNLGPGVNTPQWDAYYTMSAIGDAFMVSTDPNGYGKGDIVQVKLKEENKPLPVVLINGRVLNAKTKEPISSEINYLYLPEGTIAGTASSAPSNGEYQIVLPFGKNYSFSATASGYYAVSENLDLTALTTYKEMRIDLLLAPIEEGQVVRLNNLFFETGKSELKPESFVELEKLLALLNANPLMEISIAGHTDNVGSDESNQTLSHDRAKAVYDYLIQKGISATRLKFEGYGETRPVGTNDSEEARALNRRVEFTIVKK